MAKKQFKAESKRLLDLMNNSIYTHKEIFLRELISNASDAIDKLYYHSLTEGDTGISRDDFSILIERNEDDHTLKIIDNGMGIICQSNAKAEHLREIYPADEINPLGDWTGGTDVDTGATNRKLGSDMADYVTGGGLHGKDLSKADVSVNIYAFLKAQETGKPVQFCCAIGDETVGGIPYEEIVETARAYIKSVGGFEAFAEWGLVC